MIAAGPAGRQKDGSLVIPGPDNAALTWAWRRRNGPITVLMRARHGVFMHQSRRVR